MNWTKTCGACQYYVQVAEPEQAIYWSKCALLDVYNLPPDEETECEYFRRLRPVLAKLDD